MPRSQATSPRGLHFPLWLPVLAVVLGFVVWDAAARIRHVQQVTESYGVTVDAPRTNASSPTGYDQGRRSLILPDRSMDGYHWIMQAQAMVAEGGWRVRHVSYDHAPEGRDVHWAGPYRWWVVFLAGIDRLWSTRPWGVSIERAALVSGPVLLILLLAGVAPMLAGRFSPAAAALFAVAAVSTLPFYVDFQAGYPDHHGLVNACGLLSVLFLLVAATGNGAVAPGEPGHRDEFTQARRWVIAAAVAAGLGLWISAATQVSVLIGIGMGAAAACWLGRRSAGPDNVWIRHPVLFRIWGMTGAAVSVAAYLMEYFPHHLGLRLEVNHPLHALAWLGGGEALCRLARILGGESGDEKRRDLMAGALAAGAVAILPAVIMLTKDSTFMVIDPFLWRLHTGYISEFQSLPQYLARQGYGWASIGECLPLLLTMAALGLALQRNCPRESRSSLLLAVLPALFVLPLAWSQVRWWSLECAVLIPVLATIFLTLRRDGTDRRRMVGVVMGCALLFAPGAISAVRQAINSDEMVEDDIRALAERDAAHWLRQRAGDNRVVVAGSPTITTSLIFHGGLTGVGTLYWENAGGLKSMAAMYAAPTAEAAHDVVRRCGITHIVVVSWDGFEGVYTRLVRGLAADQPLPADAFIVQLLSAPAPPDWLRLLPFHLPHHPALDGQELRVYEVAEGRSALQVLVDATDYLLETGRMATAEHLVPSLSEYSGQLSACALLADILSRKGNGAEFARAVERMQALLAQSPTLPLDEHVRIVALLATARHFDLARDQLQQCLGKVTEERLRRLSAEKLVNLLALSDAAKVEWPDPAMRQLAGSLVPPSMRQ